MKNPALTAGLFYKWYSIQCRLRKKKTHSFQQAASYKPQGISMMK